MFSVWHQPKSAGNCQTSGICWYLKSVSGVSWNFTEDFHGINPASISGSEPETEANSAAWYRGSVIPAQAGIQFAALGSCLSGNDKQPCFYP
jgi:hypothetical protein